MKLIRVDMTSQSIKEEEVPEEYQGLGGRGLTSVMINTEVSPGCEPLGPENKLIFAPGLLSGTKLVNTGRLSVGAKSPLTAGIKESNVGGTAAAALGRLGITAVIVEGKEVDGDPYIKRQSDSEFVVKAIMPIEDFNQSFGTAFHDEEFDTVGGLLLKGLGHLPRKGETLILDDIRFEVLSADGRRIDLVEIDLSGRALDEKEER